MQIFSDCYKDIFRFLQQYQLVPLLQQCNIGPIVATM